jgi:hypothetical protein
VEISGPSGEPTTLSTDRYGVQVVSVGLDEGSDIRDIKGPMGIPMNLGPPLLILVAIVLTGILARILYRRRRRWDPELRDTRPAAPWRPPHEVALEALHALESSSFLEDGEVKEYHIQVSDILRTYIEGRFRIPALEMTTSDIMAGLGMTGTEATILDDLHRILHQCDLVKFAKQRPDPDASRAILALGRRLVEDTIPTPAPADTDSGVAEEPEPQEVGL